MIYANSFVHQDGEFPGGGEVVWYGLDENNQFVIVCSFYTKIK